MTRRGTGTAALALALTVGLSYAVFAAVTTVTRRGAQPSLAIRGSISVPLYPGASQRINARLTNRYGFPIALTRIAVGFSLDPRHRAAGCSPAKDFRVIQLPQSAYPILMRARSQATLSQLGARRLPYLAMVDRKVDQKSCHGTALTLRYEVTARKLSVRERAGLHR